MDCEFYKSLYSSYIDNDINEIDKKQLEDHLNSCEACMDEYNSIFAMVRSCNNLSEAEIPEGFHEELHEKLKSESKGKLRIKLPKYNWKWAGGIAAVFVIAIIGITQLPNLMSKSVGDTEEAYYGGFTGAARAAVPAEAPEADTLRGYDLTQNQIIMEEESGIKMMAAGYDDGAAKEKNIKEEMKSFERKIIINGSVSLEVTDFENSMKAITALVETHGGYIENSYVDNNSTYYIEGRNKKVKSGNASLRIPYDRFKIVLDEIRAIGEVLSEDTSTVDISDTYYDTETRINNLNVQESRLRELLAIANNVEEILKIENEINRVRIDIDLMSSDIRHWDKQVSMSSLYINLREITDGELSGIDVSTVWGKAYKGLIKTLNSIVSGAEILFVSAVAFLPYIVILGILAVALVFIVKKIRSKKSN